MRWLNKAKEFFSPKPFTSFAEFGGLVAVREPEPVFIPNFVEPTLETEPQQAIFATPEPVGGSQIVGTCGIWICPTTPGIRCFMLGALPE